MTGTSLLVLAGLAVALGAAALGVVAGIVHSLTRPKRRSTFVPPRLDDKEQ